MAVLLGQAQLWGDLMDETGLDAEVKAYLAARKIERIGTCASLARDTADFHAKVTEKFLAGHDINGINYTYSGDPDLSLIHI